MQNRRIRTVDSYDNTGKVSLWKNESDNPKAPQFKGKFYAHRDYREGEEITLTLWSNQNANPHGPTYNPNAPRFTGKVEDKFVPNQGQEAPPPDDDFSDPIPF